MHWLLLYILVLMYPAEFSKLYYVPDSPQPPHNSVFASPYGSCAIKVLVVRKSEAESIAESKKPMEQRQFFNVTAKAFHLDKAGEEVVSWTKPLPCIPHQLFLSEVDDVIAIDEYAHLGYRHAIIVFDKQGNALADYKLEDLLSVEEISAHVHHTVSSRHWTERARISFERHGFCVIRLDWGKVLTADVETGAVWRDFDPDKCENDASFNEAVKARRQRKLE
jgi:hypothetical protein